MNKFVFFAGLGASLLLASCGGRVLTEEEIAQYTEQGEKISMETFLTLSNNLQAKMKEGGPVEALSYCNVRAYPLTDSIAEKNNVLIKRTALKIRNPKNEPTEQEKDVLNNYQSLLTKGESLSPEIRLNEEEKAVFYAPIILAPNCVKCHGQPDSEISPEVQQKIKEFYPNDQATGFAAGDLRGIWSITFRD